jgi:hypothetical protein
MVGDGRILEKYGFLKNSCCLNLNLKNKNKRINYYVSIYYNNPFH